MGKLVDSRFGKIVELGSLSNPDVPGVMNDNQLFVFSSLYETLRFTWHSKFEGFCCYHYSMTLSSQAIKREKITTYGYLWLLLLTYGTSPLSLPKLARTSEVWQTRLPFAQITPIYGKVTENYPETGINVGVAKCRFFSQAGQTLAKSITRKGERQGLITQGRKKRNGEPNRYTEVPFVSKTFHWHHPFFVYFPTGDTWKHLQMMKITIPFYLGRACP